MTHAFFSIIPMMLVVLWISLFSRKGGSNKPLFKAIPIIAIIFFILWHLLDQKYLRSPILDSIWVFTSLSVFPLYYCYVHRVAYGTGKSRYWIWFLTPVFILSAFTALLYILMSPAETDIFTQEILYKLRPATSNHSALIKLQILRLKIYELLFMVEMLFTTIYGLQLIIRYNHKLLPYYINLTKKRNPLEDTAFKFLAVSTFAAIVSNVIEGGTFTNTAYLLAIPSISHSIAFAITWFMEFPPKSKSLLELMPAADNKPESKHEELFIKWNNCLERSRFSRNLNYA